MVRTRRGGRLPSAGPAPPPLQESQVAALPTDAQRHEATAVDTQLGDDADQTQSAQEPYAAKLSRQRLSVEGRSAALHGSTPGHQGEAASAALPDPPTVLELVVGDEVGRPAAFHRTWQPSLSAHVVMEAALGEPDI